jgi:cellulose synthase/poly-beta-1,6-N-acetylglucosamine synthase-like glycosyltransferase
MLVTALVVILYAVVAVLLVYTARHYIFTLNRLFGRQRQPYVDVTSAPWPQAVVFVPCHNEEKVVAGSLEAILANDYPPDRLTIVPVDDRSTDETGAILREYAGRYPELIRPVFRTGGTPGKAAALAEASGKMGGDVHFVFDADYVPGPRLLKQLAAPFFDPEVGAVMGRVVPHNIGNGLLTRLLDLERAGGYQVDQQARMNLHLIPQYGGTVGGVRREALASVGGWRSDTLAEDTDLTYRLYLQGWEVAYQNRSECYEEVPENWNTRIRQIRRWAHGHNQALGRYLGSLVRKPRHVPLARALDGILLLGVFAVAPILLVGWAVAIALFYLGYHLPTGVLAILIVSAFSTLGNFAAFFEVATATRLDGSRHRVRLLPFLFFGFLVSLIAVTQESLRQLFAWRRKPPVWHKTERYRGDNTNGNRVANGSTEALTNGTPDDTRNGTVTEAPRDTPQGRTGEELA